MTPFTAAPATASPARAYDELADVYDILTAAYGHNEWLEEIERRAERLGIRGRRVLDLACGTGKSFLPLLARGYEVAGIDISPRMAEIAQAKAPSATIDVADMCELAKVGDFDLVTCLDDAVNYLLDRDQLDGFFASSHRNLALGGVLVFDVNSLRVYRDEFVRDRILRTPDTFVGWSSPNAQTPNCGDHVSATIDIFVAEGGSWTRTRSLHQQRHWPRETLRAAAEAAGLRIAAVCGQHRGAVLDEHFDDLTHRKALIFAVKNESEVATMNIIQP